MAFTAPRSRTYCALLTTAQVQAGIVVVPASPNRTYTVTDIYMIATGTMTTATGVKVTDTAGTPVVVAEALTAALTNGVVVRVGATNFTTITNLGVALTPGQGIKVIADGTIAVTTALTVKIDYIVTN